MKDWLSKCNSSTHLICSLVLLLTISLKLVASYRMCLPFLLAFTSLWSLHLYAVRRNHVKEISGSFKDPARVVWRFWKRLLCLIRDYKREKLISYFLNNAAKIYLYGLKISDNIEIEYVFQSKAFCLSAFTRWTEIKKCITSTSS